MPPSEIVKRLRLRLGLTTRDIAEGSARIAAANNNPEFHISNAWLSQIENSDSVPSIFKLYSLSVLYRLPIGDVLKLYGIDLGNAGRDQDVCQQPPRKTGLYSAQIDGILHDPQSSVTSDITPSSLIVSTIGNWDERSAPFFQSVDAKKFAQGFIGLEDDFLSPLIRPGSFVQIDRRQNELQPFRWRTEFDRPIYFLHARDRYMCAWCERVDDNLLALPHPLSKAAVLRYKYSSEIEIVGRVIAVAMRLDQSSFPPETSDH